jgi:hypothetical protein
MTEQKREGRDNRLLRQINLASALGEYDFVDRVFDQKRRGDRARPAFVCGRLGT